MAVSAEKTNPVSPDAEQTLQAMVSARERTFALVSGIDDEDLQRSHSPLMSPLVWDLGHIAAYEDLWLARRHGGLELLRPDLADAYDAFETPRAVRADIEMLGPDDARTYLEDVRERTSAVLASRGVGDGAICEMVLRHELQHTETMRQTMAIAGLLPAGEPALAAMDGEEDWLEMPAGQFAMGASAEGFAYDNERPRHAVELPPFRIARRPVSNASWMRFSEGGGYERREWWSQEGWAWKEQYDITHHRAIAAGGAGGLQFPVCHISWFEADAFARSCDARLPTEAEWEKAATWRQGRRRGARGRRAGVGVDSVVLRRLSRLRRIPLSRVFRGVLRRGLQGAAGRLVGDAPARGHAHVPQLGPARATADLRGPAPGQRRSVMEPSTPPEPLLEDAIQIDSHLDGTHERSLADDALDGLTRPFKELPPKHFYDARGAQLFDRICELPEYYPTRAERAILEDSAQEIAATDRRGGTGRAGIGNGRQDACAARRPACGRHAVSLRARRRDREHGARMRARCSPTSTPACAYTA